MSPYSLLLRSARRGHSVAISHIVSTFVHKRIPAVIERDSVRKRNQYAVTERNVRQVNDIIAILFPVYIGILRAIYDSCI